MFVLVIWLVCVVFFCCVSAIIYGRLEAEGYDDYSLENLGWFLFLSSLWWPLAIVLLFVAQIIRFLNAIGRRLAKK